MDDDVYVEDDVDSGLSFYEEIVEGIKIFNKYPHSEFFRTDHYGIYGGPPPEDVSTEDVAALKRLGWVKYVDGRPFYKFT